MDTKDKPACTRQEWATRKPHWRQRENGSAIRGLPEWWDLEWEDFDGAWVLEEYGADLRADNVAQCFARLVIVGVVGRAVRSIVRAEDLAEDIAAVNAYLGRLKLAPVDLWSAKRVLAALLPFDPETLAAELLRISLIASEEGFDLSARSFARSAYDTAVAHGCHTAAQAAALALARLARLQECRRASRRWRGRGAVHGRRAVRAAEAQPIAD